MFWTKTRVVAAVAVLLVGTAGCGKSRVSTYPVTGKVMFQDGQAVKSGTIEAESIEHGTSASGSIQDDGTFTLGTYTSDDGAVPGKHRVIVVQLIISDGINKHHKNHGRPVDPKYGNYATSGLTIEVAESENAVKVTLPNH
jgi:hypothetical protein